MPTNPLIDEFRLLADGDPFAEAKDLWFTIADALYLTGYEMPEEFETYRHSAYYPPPNLDDPEEREQWVRSQTSMYGEITLQLLEADNLAPVLYAGRVITRYGRMLRAAGYEEEF